MLVIKNKSTDPHFNLASEQYILDHIDEPVFMLWRNDKTVVIGKNQNAYAEINQEFVREHNITVARRITGGGAVFHDLGNVNFTFIMPDAGADTLDFARFTAPIIEALGELGAKAELSGRNDILIDGRKVSGNAQCVYNGKVLHHGTLLYSADMSKISGALNVDPAKIASKGIKSIKSRVGNINSYINCQMDVTEFLSFLENRVDGEKREFTTDEISEIQKLKEEKYGTWEWIWGRSKEYSTVCKEYFPYGLIEACIDVDNGVIQNVRFLGDYFGVGDIEELEIALSGVRYDYDDVLSSLSNYDIARYIVGANAQDISKLLFKKPLL